MQDPPMTSTQQLQQNTHHKPSHRRAHSEVSFRSIPDGGDDLDLMLDPFDDENLFSTFMDVERFGSYKMEQSGGPSPSDLMMDSIEAKKALAPDKLAQLWTVDPKRAKRILANRQSAARSKERKSRYISELERKVHILQAEATTLSAQLSLFQRDTSGLSSENTELKFRFHSMEQQTQLRDALNDALKKEVKQLKMATGETMTSSDSYNFGMHHISDNHSSIFSQSMTSDSINAQIQQFHQMQQNMSTHHQSAYAIAHQTQAFSDMLQQDSLGRMQGLDITGRVSHLVKSECPSMPASESSSAL